ncbi:class I SAM-dependent methyltransferase [Streptomyces sp. NPDC057837]|uniref:class I SAM-dependent methyltransferase n=1 Tax=Streptomyces sp. NPDC057837 TaxID=3346260 RepID=UPI0036AD049C
MFRAAGARDVLELGARHGRDALHFAREGFTVQATDFSATGLEQLRDAASQQGVGEKVTTAVHDVRDPLRLPDACVDAVFARMLLCMALSAKELLALVAEVRRVLRPGGVFVYTVRHTGDAHYGAGTARGDDIFEHGGFAVHLFDRALVDVLAAGWTLEEVHASRRATSRAACGALPRPCPGGVQPVSCRTVAARQSLLRRSWQPQPQPQPEASRPLVARCRR